MLLALIFSIQPSKAEAGFLADVSCFFQKIFFGECGIEEIVPALPPLTNNDEPVKENAKENAKENIDEVPSVVTTEVVPPPDSLSQTEVKSLIYDVLSTYSFPTVPAPSPQIIYNSTPSLSQTSGSSIDTSNFVTRDAFDRQTSATFTSFENTMTALNTSGVPEGSNLYYTDTRVADYINASTTLAVDSINYWTKTGNDLTYTTGNVGIGATSPSEMLEVSGNGAYIQVTGTSGSDTGFTIKAGGGAPSYMYSNINESALRFWTNGDNGDDRMIIDSSGKVGIGTSSPSSLLSVSGSTGVGFTNTGTGNSFYVEDAANDTSPFVINSNGDVLVGGVPGIYNYKLNIVGSASSDTFGAAITNTAATGYSEFVAWNDTGAYTGFATFGSNYFLTELRNAGQIYTQTNLFLTANADVASGGAGEIKFTTGGYDTTLTTRATIDRNGKFGIGTTTPITLLTLHQTTGPVLTLSRNDTSITANDSVGKLQFHAKDTSTLTNVIVADIEAQSTNTISTDINPGRLIFRTTPTGVGAAITEAMRITEAQNVGIGTASPSARLDVRGGAGVIMTSLDNGAGTAYICTTLATGALSTSTSACNPSSMRFKDNVENLSYGLGELLLLRPVSFTYKPEMLITGNQVGFIAEEIVEIIPETVGFDKDGKVYNVDYSKLTPLLVSAVQELNAKVEVLSGNSKSTRRPNNSQSSQINHFDNSLGEKIVAFLNDMYDILIEKGLLRVAEIVANRLTITESLEIGSSEKPIGFVMYDEISGKPYCITIKKGDFIKTPGMCDEQDEMPSNSNSGSSNVIEVIEKENNEELKDENKEEEGESEKEETLDKPKEPQKEPVTEI